jgi:hypothetical protein
VFTKINKALLFLDYNKYCYRVLWTVVLKIAKRILIKKKRIHICICKQLETRGLIKKKNKIMEFQNLPTQQESKPSLEN